MTNLSNAQQIADGLTKGQAWRSRGKVAVCVASILLNVIPFAGGAVARLLDEAGAKFLDAGLEAKFTDLCKLIADLEPTLARAEDLNSVLALMQQTIAENEAIRKRIEEFATLAFPVAREFKATNVASTQEFVNVTISNMRAIFVTTQGGQTLLHGVKTHGEDVQFRGTSGGHQRVINSEFSGSGGSVGMNNIGLSGQVKTLTDNTAGVALGPGGTIGFGPGGVLGFGPPPPKKK